MGKIIAAVLGWLLGLLVKKPAGPSADERVGRAEAKLETREATDAAVQDALDARRAADARIVRDPASARAPDRYSRD